MKKKILFCLQTMVMGGVEKELITVLKRLDRAQFDIELLLFYIQDTNIMKSVPEDVKVTVLQLDKAYWLCNGAQYVKSRLKKGRFAEAVQVAVKTALNGGASSAYVNLQDIQTLPGAYDCAICYHMHSGMVLRYVAEKVNAKKKVAWIHNDFATTGYKIECYEKDLKKYDSIVAVSDRLREEFMSHCPVCGDRAITIHNIVDEEEIQEKAAQQPDASFQNDTRIKLVTVGRYVEQKGFDLAISVCRILKDKGLDVSWYAIGWGPDEEKLRKLVEEEQLQDCFYLTGRKENPYPYMAGADIYVQPSRHEGYGITIAEAKTLKKIIVCTDFAGASEQIENGVNGVVAKSFSPDAIADAILRICTDGAYREKLQQGFSQNGTQGLWEKMLSVLS